MSHQPLIDGLEFAKTGARLGGEWRVADFSRLRGMLCSDEGMLRYRLSGIPNEGGRPTLRLWVDVALQLPCQRCLAPLEFRLQRETSLQLALTQAEIDAEPLVAEGSECILAGKAMVVQTLIEDELLLAIPLAPRHDDCGREAVMRNLSASDDQATELAEARQLPFVGLRGLMNSNKH